MKFTYIPAMTEDEKRRNLNINAFQRGSKVYCAVCSRRGFWIEVKEFYGFLHNDIPMYKFCCHGEVFIIMAEHFNETKRINGPANVSYVTFD